MKAFHSNKPLYSLFLGCINATLLLLIFMASGTTTPPPSKSSGHSHALVHGQYIVPLIKMRKMVTTATSLVRDLPPQYRFYPALHHGTDAAAAAQQLRLSKLISTRRSLLHLSEGPADHHKLMSTTTMAVPIDATSHAAASTTSTNIPHDHEADVSATFHVDYSGPKTHPPKNN